MQKAVPFARARRARDCGSCNRSVNLAHRTCLADDMADLAAQDGKAVVSPQRPSSPWPLWAAMSD